MKRLIYRIKAILSSNSGETLMEGVVALLVLSALLTTVTLMISTSLRWTGSFIHEESEMQLATNEAVTGDRTQSRPGQIVLTNTTGTSFTVRIDVQIFDTDERPIVPDKIDFPFVSFEPAP